ncbi:hypothetical protein EXIGLDRAFT_669509 [Exidia glandulosa HHB12029]|uniref:RING-type domain-containing protein n=1 Tax=Exidia glandulosa HHB12029 TaxID=1314781 RepID=A0A165LUC7_EXIGL|nr:hypothetical protein EXIGLDRAFT_669509 [Exidia glandulosa HHB12029]
MLTVLSSSTCDICARTYKPDGARTPSVIPCGHILCRGCLSNLDPRACPFCRVPFQWESVKKVHCEFRALPGSSSRGPVASDKEQRATKLERRIVTALNAPKDPELIAKCERLVGKVHELLMGCREEQFPTLRAQLRTLQLHVEHLELLEEYDAVRAKYLRQKEVTKEVKRDLTVAEDEVEDLTAKLQRATLSKPRRR